MNEDEIVKILLQNQKDMGKLLGYFERHEKADEKVQADIKALDNKLDNLKDEHIIPLSKDVSHIKGRKEGNKDTWSRILQIVIPAATAITGWFSRGWFGS